MKLLFFQREWVVSTENGLATEKESYWQIPVTKYSEINVFLKHKPFLSFQLHKEAEWFPT